MHVDLANSQGLPGSQSLIEIESFNATLVASFDSDDAFGQSSRDVTVEAETIDGSDDD
jgi:hypothetical protein